MIRDDRKRVSACIITYNHEPYIRECLDGALNQIVDFEYEVVVGDDCSSDKTLEICREYLIKYPDKMRLISRNSNLGMIGNWMQTIKSCVGDYIAVCEGDDYWTDENKIKTQFNYLETHSEYVGCFHNTEERYEEDEYKASFLYCNYDFARDISFTDLSYGNPMPTCSVMFKANLFVNFPIWYTKLKMADWPLHLINAQFGNFWYIPKIMGVHRLHSKSTWMLQDPDRNVKYMLDAYDALIIGFEKYLAGVETLTLGREALAGRTRSVPMKVGFKHRVKSFLKKVIDKI